MEKTFEKPNVGDKFFVVGYCSIQNKEIGMEGEVIKSGRVRFTVYVQRRGDVEFFTASRRQATETPQFLLFENAEQYTKEVKREKLLRKLRSFFNYGTLGMKTSSSLPLETLEEVANLCELPKYHAE